MKKGYDKTIGYSPLEDVDENKLWQLIKINKKIIDQYCLPAKNDMILVAGAGSGQEAVLINKEFQLKTIGVDLNINQNDLSYNKSDLFLQKQDLASLAFSGDTFSLVYCYHVLEHVSDHLAVLREVHRVLKPGGVLFIGFPNKNRLISYIGTAQKVSSLDKIKWNLTDYLDRLRGRFENKYGAHAGFTEREFIEDASRIFDSISSVRKSYMLLKYTNLSMLIKLIISIKLEEFVFPSNYYICTKRM